MIKITKSFAFAHHGYTVVQYGPDSASIPDDAAEWALQHGYAVKADEAAPENKDAARRPRQVKAHAGA